MTTKLWVGADRAGWQETLELILEHMSWMYLYEIPLKSVYFHLNPGFPLDYQCPFNWIFFFYSYLTPELQKYSSCNVNWVLLKSFKILEWLHIVYRIKFKLLTTASVIWRLPDLTPIVCLARRLFLFHPETLDFLQFLWYTELLPTFVHAICFPWVLYPSPVLQILHLSREAFWLPFLK